MSSVELDEGQRRVVDGAPGDRRMVTAGPGAGKTSTAVALIASVLDRVGDDAMVLFVSFSNAAIDAALDSMIDLDDSHGERVMAMTLDSLAAQLVDDEPVAGRQPDFTRRLTRATEQVIASDGEDLSSIAYLIVDEAQDMSAERRAFLLAVIAAMPASSGFTIFGDPWQAIYSFGSAEGRTSAWGALYDDLNVRESRLLMLDLDGEYRARSTQVRRIASSLSDARSSSIGRDIVEERLEEALIHTVETNFDRLQRSLLGWRGGATILAWRNSEVLDIIDAIRRHGIQCDRIEPVGSSKPRIAPWVAELFYDTGGRSFDVSDFDDFCDNHPEVRPDWFRTLAYAIEAVSAKLAWPMIAHMMQRDHVRSRPWHQPPAAVAVSTIHQSKGREFDNVVIANPDRLLRPPTGEPQLELLYVALTRAHDRVLTLSWEAPWSENVPGTHTRIRKLPRRRRPSAISVVSSDARRTRAVGGRRGQEVLATAQTGDLVSFERLNSTEMPVYRLLLSGEAVGVTTEQFGEVVKRVCRDRWPALGPIPLEGVETIVSAGVELDFSLQPRLAGFSDLTF